MNTTPAEHAAYLTEMWEGYGYTHRQAVADLRGHYAREIAEAETDGTSAEDIKRMRDILAAL